MHQKQWQGLQPIASIYPLYNRTLESNAKEQQLEDLEILRVGHVQKHRITRSNNAITMGYFVTIVTLFHKLQSITRCSILTL